MFGYVTPLKPEMKIREYETFRAYYCGICMHIKKQFGNIPRMALNYDMTFLAILLDALHGEGPKFEKRRCIAHPHNKKPMAIEGKALSYAAAMNVSLIYYKLIDDVNDDKSIKSEIGAMVLSTYKKKFNRNVTMVNDIIEENLNRLSLYEKNKGFDSIDEVCDPFSLIVANILKLYPEEIENDSQELRDDLYNLGYAIGKWIYVIDALDDLEEDIEKNKFNPINYLFNKNNKPYKEFLEDIKPRIEFTILNCGYNCKEALDNLPIKRNKEILENIISLGMMDKYTKIVEKCNCNSSKERGIKDESV